MTLIRERSDGKIAGGNRPDHGVGQKRFVIADVGANVGFYARQFAHAVGASGHVHAFEPSEKIREMMKLGGLDNITTMPFALSKSRGTCWLDGGEQNDGATARDCGSEQVHVETGDYLTASRTARSPNLIKIDVDAPARQWSVNTRWVRDARGSAMTQSLFSPAANWRKS